MSLDSFKNVSNKMFINRIYLIARYKQNLSLMADMPWKTINQTISKKELIFVQESATEAVIQGLYFYIY